MQEQPLIIAVAPNGAYKNAEAHPALPLTAEAMGHEAKRCLDAGASLLHLHVRDAQGRHSLSVEGYRDATRAVRRAVGVELVVQVTSEAGGVFEPQVQIDMVRALHPEALSVALRELERPGLPPGAIEAFFEWLAREHIMTQVILYDAADALRWRSMVEQGRVPPGRWFVLFVLGRYTDGQTSHPLDLLPFLAGHPPGQPWAMCAFGRAEHACAVAAAALGGHVRVGFENNLYLKDGSVAPGNWALVAQAAEGARVLGRRLAVADDIRRQFASRSPSLESTSEGRP